jgi:RNA polymerase sigma factor (sigma-70 family)
LGARHRYEDAEDVVQDAFARAFVAINEQRFHGEFKRWLFTIARNRSIDLLRGERVSLVPLDVTGIESGPRGVASGETPAALAETRDEVAWLLHAIEELPERQRSALLLRELGGFSHHAIAEELETTAGSARQLITRARKGVRIAAERDGRRHGPVRGPALRRELLGAVPLAPLAAAGLAASAGGGAGGALVLGKMAASVLAALVLAAAAGPVSRDVAGASPSLSQEQPGAAAVGGPFETAALEQGSSSNGEHGSKTDSRGTDASPRNNATRPTQGDAPQSERSDGDAVPASDSGDASGRAGVETPQASTPKVTQPVQDVVDLPGKAIDHVSDGLSGATPIDQTVGNVVGDVTGTLSEVTTGVLGSR